MIGLSVLVLQRDLSKQYGGDQAAACFRNGLYLRKDKRDPGIKPQNQKEYGSITTTENGHYVTCNQPKVFTH